MKKSLIALAVAGIFAAPAIAATGNVDVYGVMNFSVDIADTNEVGDSSDMVTGMDNFSRIGFKGSEDLGGGLKAVWQIEEQLNASMGALAHRNTFVGVSGGFGTVILGRHDTPYKMSTGSLDPMGDTIGDYNAIVGRTASGTGGATIFDRRAPMSLMYVTPNMGGLSGAIMYEQTKTNETVAGVSTDETRGWSAMGKYANGPILATLAYETHEGSFGAGAVQGAGAIPADDISAWKLGLGYTIGSTKLGVIFEDISDGDVNGATAFGRPNERDAWYVSVSHGMGPITLKAAYGNADSSKSLATSDDGANFWALGADYALSKRTSAYARYATVGNDGDLLGAGSGYTLQTYGGMMTMTAGQANDVDAFSVGVKHTF